jgi:hypothetical protein
MNKEFIPYEQALALKELGFDKPCFGYYNVSNQELIEDLSNNRTGNDDSRWASAPLYQQAFRWFREKYDLGHMINGIEYESFIMNIGGIITVSPMFKTYEEAELSSLKKLIEIANEKTV